MDFFDKCLKIYEQTQGLRKTGHYFFFRKLKSPQDAEVVVDGKRVIMVCKFLFENDVFVNPVVSPAVPLGRKLLRTSYMATHTEEQLDRVLDAFKKVGKQLRLI